MILPCIDLMDGKVDFGGGNETEVEFEVTAE